MSEIMYSGRKSHPERYINRISASVVALFKLLDGIVAGISLYHIFRMLSPLMAQLAKGVLDINQAIQMIEKEYGLSGTSVTAYSGIAVGGMALPFIIWGGILFVIIVGLLLVVIEAISLLFLRIAWHGTGFIKIVHQIYMVVWIINLLLFGYLTFTFFRYSQSLQSESARVGANTFYIIFGIIILIILLLNICYHKDIAMAMDTVGYEIETGNQGNLKRTHLSGISFLFALPYAWLVLMMVVGIAGINSGYVDLPDGATLTMAQSIYLIAVPAILMIKHLSICFCNRNLKRAR